MSNATHHSQQDLFASHLVSAAAEFKALVAARDVHDFFVPEYREAQALVDGAYARLTVLETAVAQWWRYV